MMNEERLDALRTIIVATMNGEPSGMLLDLPCKAHVHALDANPTIYEALQKQTAQMVPYFHWHICVQYFEMASSSRK
jgi:hypothetical protein